uniref:protein IQ-DOMAIN 13-like n=1 Tax=Erigeron canadensis TaxID=72917 RepID=UPI001CB9CB62|nr:protein IQ-DOMAIN 13-like [Erigeron canadensis]XP_043607124.1 protein IQ-DOMAIN 13-like [Erigeron canadensis]XP_043607125.1 protein IQ-DOMAIN 13-like [Erigeron canadensis]
MGMKKKEGSSWVSRFKKVFTSKHNPPLSPSSSHNEEEKSLKKESKGGVRSRFKRALFREPSSIEKILEDIDRHHFFVPQPLLQQSQPQLSVSPSSLARPASPPPPPRINSPPNIQITPKPEPTARPASPPPPPRINSPNIQITPKPEPTARPASPPPPRINSPPNIQITPKPEPTLQQQHCSATRIQAAYRAYLARKKVKGLTGLVRLQGVVRGQNVKRQTVNAMKQMQLLVRVQTQIQSQRIQMLQNQRQPNKQLETSLGKDLSKMGDGYWDDSLITKEERDARLQKKVEAVINRERAMAYAYSHQLGKGTPTSAKTSLIDTRTGGYPWWWNWLERQLPSQTQPMKASTTHDIQTQHDHLETPPTPMSSRSMVPPRSSTPPNRMMRYSKARGGGGSPYPVRDNDSLMSCPAFSVPNYMSPTISAKAKARPTSNPKDRVTPSTPGSETSSKRRFSFPFTPNNKWIKHKSPGSIGGLSMDSAPASVGRKPFNRFV